MSLFIRSLLSAILFPGLVTLLIPYFILKERIFSIFSLSFSIYQYSGVLVFISCLIVLLNCIINFAVKGKGTLSPLYPAKKLVITGFYRFSRNPMYAGVILMLIGEAVFFKSLPLLIYLVFIFNLFSLFIKFYEEPALKKEFKEDYFTYCENVRRWI